MPNFEYRSQLAGDLERAFQILTTPETILKVTTPEMGLSFVRAPKQYGLDEIIEFKIINFGMVQKVIHRITTFETPTLFVEEMLEGPLPRWIHTHRFVDLGNGQLEMIDEIDFEPPGGLIGIVANEHRIIQQLEAGLDQRHTRLERLLR